MKPTQFESVRPDAAAIVRTKVVATVGPASRDPAVLRRLIAAGCDVFRINFSHGTLEDHAAALDGIRSASRAVGVPVAVMADLCGPKIRLGAIAGGTAVLAEGTEVVVVRDPVEGDAGRVSTTLPELIDEVEVGQDILIDDGRLRLTVVQVDPPRAFVCRVVRGGPVSSGKGVNLPQTRLTLSALTEKDRGDAAWIAEREFDYVALSFVRHPDDILALRSLLAERGGGAHIVAKIEKPQALDCLDAIVHVADGVMVARGDLGVEMDLPSVPIAQKRIIRTCHAAGKPCIVATQMFESMITAPSPTRAEVSDVANAVFDGADAVMLSGETAIGAHPVEAVAMMNRVLLAAEAHETPTEPSAGRGSVRATPETGLAEAVRALARPGWPAACAVFTITGSTARTVSKLRLPCPILGMSPDPAAVRRMCLYRGVVGVEQTDPPGHTRDVLSIASRMAKTTGVARDGDMIAVLTGRPIGKPGMTNTLVLHRIGADPG